MIPSDRARRADGDHPRPRLPHRRHDLRPDGHPEAYRTGRGKVIVRAKYEIEELKDGRSQIVFTEIPYQLTKEPLLKKLAELVNGGRITGVSDIDDDSATASSRCGSPSRSRRARTPTSSSTSSSSSRRCRTRFSVIMLALVDGRPKTLPLKEFLRLFVEHRVNVIRRRTQYPAPPGAAAGAHRRGPADRAGLHRRDHPRDPRRRPTRPRPAPGSWAWRSRPRSSAAP